MDGFGTDSNVIVLGSTNLKETLDEALLRPGRFDRNVEVSLPDIIDRERVFEYYLNKIKIDETKSLSYYAKRLATLTPGFSNADIKNIVNEAAIVAVRWNSKFCSDLDFEEAIERVIGGLERTDATLLEN